MGGYIGEAFVLECTARGIATCWLGASYKKSKVREFVDIKEDETLACIIAFGFYDGKVKHTKKKSIEQLTGLNAAAFSALPAWQQEAVNCARLSPSALNKQPWELDIKEDSIELINNSNNWGFGGVDCGIAMLHLELGAEFSANGSLRTVRPCLFRFRNPQIVMTNPKHTMKRMHTMMNSDMRVRHPRMTLPIRIFRMLKLNHRTISTSGNQNMMCKSIQHRNCF